MAAAVVANPSTHTLGKPNKPTRTLPKFLIEGAKVSHTEAFDYDTHISFQFPEKIYTMEEIGKKGKGISDTAVSAPFQLFTPEAIRQMRAEIFSDPVLENYQVSSKLADNMIRSYCPGNAPFIYDAWNNPKVLDHLSKVAGVDLVPAMAADIGHINISVDVEGTKATPGTNAEEQPAFAWHFDSYAFVCVTMLSDCTGMVGGETMIRCEDGTTKKVRGPTQGTAVMMQGRYIEHSALKAFGGRERISMVTAFRPKSSHVLDETVITPLFDLTPVTMLYHQFAEYRLENLEERVRDQLKVIRRNHEAKKEFDVMGARKWLHDQRDFIDYTLKQLVENPEAMPGREPGQPRQE